MADETAKLVLAVDSTQAKAAAKDLDALTESAGRTAQKQREIAEALQRNQQYYAANAEKVRRQEEAMGLYRGGVTKTATELGKLITQEEQAAQAAAKLATQQAKAETAAKKSTGAHQGLSLASGQAAREYAVLVNELQRGDFTRFQGSLITLANRIGLMPMLFTGMGAAALGVVAVLGTFAAAAIKGSIEQHNFNKQLIATGDFAHTTYGGVELMAQSMTDSVASIGQTSEALIAVTGSGRFFNDEIRKVSQGVLDFSHLTGASVEDAVKEFIKLKEDPLRAAQELDKTLHFLTITQRDAAQAAQDHGDTEKAAAIVLDALAQSSRDRMAKERENVGWLEQAWNSLRNTVSGAWHAMADMGKQGSIDLTVAERTATLISAKEDLDQALQKYKAGSWTMSREDLQDRTQTVKNLTAELAKLQKQQYDSHGPDREAANQQRVEEATKRATQAIHDQAMEHDRAAQRAAAIEKTHHDFGIAREAFPTDVRYSLAAEAAAVKVVEHQYRDYREAKRGLTAEEKAARAEQRAQETQYNSLSKSIAEHRAAVDAAAKSEDKLTEIERWAVKTKADLHNETNHLSAAQIKQAEAEIDGIVATDAANRAREQAAKTTEEAARALERYQKTAQSRERNQQRDIDAIGHSAAWAEEQRRIYEIIDQAENARIALTDKARAAQQLESDEYKKGLQDIATEMNNQLGREKNFYEKRKEAMGDWRNGAQRAWEEFSEKAMDVAGQTYDAWNSAFNALNSAIDQFAANGKVKMADLARTILAELLKIELRILLSRVLTSIFGAGTGGTSGEGGFGSESFGAGGGSQYGPQGLTPSARGNAFFGGNQLTVLARGGIVNSPTLFPMARGMGLMGEAGPEAVMPLKRTADGRLGVAASSHGGGMNFSIPVSVTVNGDGSSSASTGDSDERSQQGKMLAQFLGKKIKEALVEEQRQGGILWRMQNG